MENVFFRICVGPVNSSTRYLVKKAFSKIFIGPVNFIVLTLKISENFVNFWKLWHSYKHVTFETLTDSILTVENLDSWQSLLPDNQEWHKTAFAILLMFWWWYVFFPNKKSSCAGVKFLNIKVLLSWFWKYYFSHVSQG